MEHIAGSDMLKSSLGTGTIPILFSSIKRTPFRPLKIADKGNYNTIYI